MVAELPDYRQSVSSTQTESMLRIFGDRASSLSLSETNGQMGEERASDLFLEKSIKVRLALEGIKWGLLKGVK